MNRNEMREKIIKRRNLISTIFTIILFPLLLPLGIIYKLGEIAELIQNPFITWRNKMVENYKNKLEKTIDKV